MTFPVTTMAAVPLAIIMLALWVNVTRTRADTGVSIGHADDPVLHNRIRMHGNFIEWVPMSLILLLLSEAAGVSHLWLYVAGGLMVAGRVLHPFGLRPDVATHPLRIIGNSANLLAVGVLIVALARAAFGF